MKRATKLAIAVTAAGLGLAVAAVAHPDGMGHGMMMMHQGDQAFGADMQLVHGMLQNNEKIKRTVTNLPDGIRTVTESDDPKLTQAIQAHVASMRRPPWTRPSSRRWDQPSSTDCLCSDTVVGQWNFSSIASRSLSAATGSPWVTKTRCGARGSRPIHASSSLRSAWAEIEPRLATSARTATYSPWILISVAPPASAAPRVPAAW